jgi:N-[(2S)-2-amino-2-carboxyethyl]-L-glutamate dehydrogenase
MIKYLNKKDILHIGSDWSALLSIILKATGCISRKEYSQPVKSYLRYNDLKNRIISMPAYIGGEFATAGVKWIASFPGNLHHDLPRAHSTVLLNDAATGVPKAILNSALISGIRTAAVSGALIDKYIGALEFPEKCLNFGIVGFGPIGRFHLDMIGSMFFDCIDQVFLFDLNPRLLDDIPDHLKDKVVICDSWKAVFNNASIFMTCTVSDCRYIDAVPRASSLHMNISLRDYEVSFFNHVDMVIVDSWEEVCRENTDIENAHKAFGLGESAVITLSDVLCDGAMKNIADRVVMFNPMGMAAYDVAIAHHYYEQALQMGLGMDLED